MEMKLCCKMLGTAMTANFLNRDREKARAFSSAGMRRSRQNTTSTASTQLTPWHKKVAQATPATPMSKVVTKRMVHQDVAGGGAGQEDEGGLGVPQGGEDAGGHVVKEHERQAVDVDIQIQGGVRHDLLRGVDGPQQIGAKGQPHRHQHGADHGTGDQGRMDGGLHVGDPLGAEELRHDDRAADVAPKGKGNEDQSDLIAVAHGGQGVFAHEFTCHQAVGDVVQLLEHDAAEQRQAEFPKDGLGIAHRQILFHNAISPISML